MIDATRYPLLSKVDSPAELRQLPESDLRAVADELRAYLIESVGKSGGHFGAGLGVVELTTVLHYMYDPREARTFYVYPPAAVGASVDVTYAAMPVDIVEPAEGALYTAVAGNLGLPDIYGNTVQDYILYRAYTKDSEYAGNAARAQAHYAAFANALGVEIKGTIAIAPNPVGNPNRTAMTPQV